MIGIAAAYMSGLFFASFFSDVYGIIILTAAVFITLAAAKLHNFSRYDLYMIFFSFLVAVTVSLTYSLYCYYGVTEFAGQTGSFSGKVVDYEVYEGDKAAYIIKGKINDRKSAKIRFYTSELGAEYGDIITLENCEFQKIEGDYLFDSETFYKSRHIFICSYKAENIDIKYTDSCRIKKFLSAFREDKAREICRITGKETGGFLVGMIFGEKQYLDENTKTSLYRIGIGHILAVSGLHVSIVAAVLMFVMKKLRINKYLRFIVINIFFILFISLVNYPVSAIRATLMLDISYAAPLFRKQNDNLNSIALAAFIISICDPYSVYSSGFILSLSGTFGLAVFGRYMSEKIENKYEKNIVISVCTAFSVMPLCMYYFDETSLISPFSNIFIVPLCVIALLCGILYILTFGFITVLLYIADILIKTTLYLSDKISSVDFTYIPHMNSFMSLLFILSGVVVVCVYIIKGNERAVAVSVAVSVIICSVAFIISDSMRNKNMIIAVLGKGNSSVIIISHKNQTNIIDLSGNYRSAEYVRKYLSENGINNVDMLILTQKTASQYVNYESELESFNLNACFALNDKDIYNGKLGLLGKSGFKDYSGEYIIEYNNNIFTVVYDDYVVNFSAAKDNARMNGLSVYYGNITKNTEIFDNSIYLDDMNNFEIILKNGEYEIRSLYG